MKNKINLLVLSVITLFISLNFTYCHFDTSATQTNTFKTVGYRVNLDGTGGSYISESIILKNNKLILPSPTREGYSFKGYSLTNGGATICSKTIDNIFEINNKTLYSNWSLVSYSISYDLNGGTISGNPTAYNIESNSFTLPQPTRNGYTFSGWTGSNGEIPQKNVTINKGTTGAKNYKANWTINTYSISYNLNGGTISGTTPNYNVETNSFTLPQPTRTGYTFSGWTGSNGGTPQTSVTVSKGSTGNKSYTANWNVNYYTVNYYVSGSLWTQRNVAYGSTPEYLDAQSTLDRFHKFNSWDGWVNNMPNYTVNLYANITQSYCALLTGHGPYGNAEALLRVFQSAGWSGKIEEAPSAPGNYWVVTDYTLTREQAEIQKNYIADHTNYRNYNFPYLYWVAVTCTNGIGDTWTRSSGQKTFKSIY